MILFGTSAASLEEADFPFWDKCFRWEQTTKAAKKTLKKLLFSLKNVSCRFFRGLFLVFLAGLARNCSGSPRFSSGMPRMCRMSGHENGNSPARAAE
ncbi:hypothetical protein [Agrobacterium sp. NPDC089420]|uniref:hypothetical protein n=1 Tax=Agrobacterium sp. NPDC089420 TaxID=3363918 RepID=UPI003850BAB1